MQPDKREQVKEIARKQSLWENFDGLVDEYDYKTKLAQISDPNDEHKYITVTLNPTAEEHLLKNVLEAQSLLDAWGENAPLWSQDESLLIEGIKTKINKRRASTRTMPVRVGFDKEDGKAYFIKTTKFTGHLCKNLDIINFLDGKNFHATNDDSLFLDIDDNHMYYGISTMFEKEIHGNFLSKNVVNQHQVGDVLGFGVIVRNSQTGGGLNIGMFMKRLKCLNGLIGRDNMFWQTNSHIYPDMMDRLDKGIGIIIGKGEDFANIIEKSRNQFICKVDDIPKCLKMVHIPERHWGGIVEAYKAEPIDTTTDGYVSNYSLGNAVTRYATHTLPKTVGYTIKERYDLMGTFYPILGLGVKLEQPIVLEGV